MCGRFLGPSPSYAQLLQAEQKRVPDTWSPDKGAQEALDGWLKGDSHLSKKGGRGGGGQESSKIAAWKRGSLRAPGQFFSAIQRTLLRSRDRRRIQDQPTPS